MSRIGKKPIVIPEGTTVEVENNVVTVKGKLGTLTQKFRNDVVIEVKGNEVHVTLPENPTQFSTVYHGTARALINNMVVGCSEGFKVALEIKGMPHLKDVRLTHRSCRPGRRKLFIISFLRDTG